MRTIWIASYPKSGNTWFRIMLSNLRLGEGTSIDINDLDSDGIASARLPFDNILMVDSGVLTPEEIDNLRPHVHAEQARGVDDELIAADETPPVRMVKVHDAYCHNAKGEAVLGGAAGSDGAIVIVRDPRDMVASLANHNGSTLDDAIDYLANDATTISWRPYRQEKQFRQRLGSWSSHTASWLDQRDIPIHLVRYEEMIADPVGSFRGALAFARYPAGEDEIARAVGLADFAHLQSQERQTHFREAPPNLLKSGGFFRKGKAGQWPEELSLEQVRRVEAAHGPMMRRLGYALSPAPDVAVAVNCWFHRAMPEAS